MKIAVIGSSGFLGQRLVQSLLSKDSISVNGKDWGIDQILAVDNKPAEFEGDDRVISLKRDLNDVETSLDWCTGEIDLIFHLAAIVSGEAERDFDLGMRVNLHFVESMLERCRSNQNAPVIVFASTCAVFGGDVAQDDIRDHTCTIPESSYGTQKAISELLINDYSRRNFINGRSLRLPTIMVRSGSANAAMSSFASNIVREPLAGRTTVCRVAPSTQIWVLSPDKVIQNILHAAGLSSEQLGNNRIITLPGITTSVANIVDSMTRLTSDQFAKSIQWDYDEDINRIVSTWPVTFSIDRASRLGFEADKDIDEIVGQYLSFIQ